ncbi:hypothetical protein GC194_00210 [bacterium]|nr:hypothetical protein [bacterium]
MRNLYLITIFLLAAASLAKAQYGNQYQYNPFFKTSGAFDYPSELGTDIKKFSVNLFGANMYLGNSVADVNFLYNIATRTEMGKVDGNSVPVLRNSDGTAYLMPHVLLDHIVNQTPNTNFLVGGLNLYPPIALAYKIKAGADKKEVVTFSFNHRLRVGSSYYFGKDLFSMLYNGNGSFGNTPVNLIDFDLKFHAYSEWAFGAAFPVVELGNSMKIRGGFNLKYLVGYAAFDTKKANLSMTNQNGKEWDFKLDYLFNLAVPGTVFNSNENLNAADYARHGIGRGLGFDVGGSIQIMKNLKAYAAVNDIGSIRYGGSGVRNYSGTGDVKFDGVRFQIFNRNDYTSNQDTLLTKFEPKETELDFNMALPTRITLGGEFGIGEMETRKGQTFFKHNFHFTYIQGLNRAPGNSTRPFINAAYAYRIGNILSLGLNTGYGGIYGFNIGGFLGFRGGPFRLGIASNALLGGLAPQVAKGADLTLNIGFAF